MTKLENIYKTLNGFLKHLIKKKKSLLSSVLLLRPRLQPNSVTIVHRSDCSVCHQLGFTATTLSHSTLKNWISHWELCLDTHVATEERVGEQWENKKNIYIKKKVKKKNSESCSSINEVEVKVESFWTVISELFIPMFQTYIRKCPVSLIWTMSFFRAYIDVLK